MLGFVGYHLSNSEECAKMAELFYLFVFNKKYILLEAILIAYVFHVWFLMKHIYDSFSYL